jgi:glycosyltransferase involved in cell wall biosynthesis
VIPSYNEECHIRDCLRSVLDQSAAFPYEVIVVDSSTDTTAQIISREFPVVHLIHRDRKTSPAEARNLGIEQSRSPIVAFIDADCVADPSWMEALVSAHEGRHPAIGGSISLAEPYTLAGAMLFAIEFSEFLPSPSPREIRWLPSCNLSVKREALVKYGVFPTHMEASEDILFSRTLAVRSGSGLLFHPNVRAFHFNRNNLADFRRRLRKLGYWSGRSRASSVIPGNILSRHSALVPLLVPYRLLLILVRLLLRSGHRRIFALCLLCWPLLLYGLVCWARAFSIGVGRGDDRPGDRG